MLTVGMKPITVATGSCGRVTVGYGSVAVRYGSVALGYGRLR